MLTRCRQRRLSVGVGPFVDRGAAATLVIEPLHFNAICTLNDFARAGLAMDQFTPVGPVDISGDPDGRPAKKCVRVQSAECVFSA